MILLVTGLAFLAFKNVSNETLNLKRLNPLVRNLYQKTVEDLSSKSGRNQIRLSISKTTGEIQVCGSLVCSVFLLSHLL